MDWAYSGVNTTVPRNAGPACAEFLSPWRRRIETVIVLAAAATLLKWGYNRISLPTAAYVRRDRGGRRALLVLMSIIWGMEIGYKFSSKTVIYLLNPCHVTTAIQIYLLAASPNNIVTAVFRIHLNLLNGPLLAFLFPETDTRILPLEAAIYWIQHGLMFVVPYYLLRLGGVYNVEEISDFSWNAVSYSLNIFYHFVVLQTIAVAYFRDQHGYSWYLMLVQPTHFREAVVTCIDVINGVIAPTIALGVTHVAMPTEVNLNHMLCPAILDPFEGPYYRFCAVLHQALLCPLLCKIFCLISAFFLTKFWPTKVKKTLCCEVAVPNTNGDVLDTNTHDHID